LGLLFSVHPLWGLLGLLRHFGSLDAEGRRGSVLVLPFLVGLSPYLWVVFRAGKFFPSWGGEHPFWEILKGWKGPWAAKVAAGFEPASALAAFGVVTGALTALALGLLLLSSLKWRPAGRPLIEPMDFWTGVTAAGAGVLFFSQDSGTLSPVALWFPVGVGGVVVRLLERGWERKQADWMGGPRLAGAAGAVLLLSVGAAWALGEKCLRAEERLPFQHAVNLLRTLPEPKDEGTGWVGGALLVCEDPFEASACLQARLIQPFKLGAIILERRYLNRRWMVAECVKWEPRLLFSRAEGSTLGILRSLIQDNGDLWEIHWAVSELADALGMGPATPTVLTHAFRKGGVSPEARNAQYHIDLTPLLGRPGDRDRFFRRCLARYATGFHGLGRQFLASGRSTQAIQAFERSVKLDPEYAEPQMQLSDLYAKGNILEAARLEFEKVLKGHPVLIAQKVKALEKEGGMEGPRVAGRLDELIRLNGELAEAQFQLYRILEKQGRGGEARALLEAAARSNPKRIEVQLVLGRQMVKAGNAVKAEEAFRAVLLVDPQNKEAQKELWKLLNR
jgi:tetratricopeptide (TPR) repeat protein